MASNSHSTNLSVDSILDGKNEDSRMKEDFNVYKTTYVKMYDFHQSDNTKDGQSEIVLTIKSKTDGSIFETHAGLSTSKIKAITDLAKNFLKNTALERPRGLNRINRAISSPNARIEKKKVHFRLPNESPIHSQSEQVSEPSRTVTESGSNPLQVFENSTNNNNLQNQTGGLNSSVPFAIFEENANSSFDIHENHREPIYFSDNQTSHQDNSNWTGQRNLASSNTSELFSNEQIPTSSNQTNEHDHSNSFSNMENRDLTNSESGHFFEQKCPNQIHNENCPVKHSEGYIYDRLPPDQQIEFLNKKRKKGTRGGKRWKVKLNYTAEECLGYRIVKNKLKVKIKWKSHDDKTYAPSFVPIEDCWEGSHEIFKELVNKKEQNGDQKLGAWLEKNGYIFEG